MQVPCSAVNFFSTQGVNYRGREAYDCCVEVICDGAQKLEAN